MGSDFIPYVNFAPRTEIVKSELMSAVSRVIDGGQFILGPEVENFEKEFAQYCGTKYAIGVSNGTDALILALQALSISAGDEVITAPNSFVATASAIALCGAKPVFVDIGDDLNLDPSKLETAINQNTKAIIPVHLAGKPAAMNEINKIAQKHNLAVIEDAAQAVGSKLDGKKTGTWGILGCFSLHPLKNLHAYGDAGIITTDSLELCDKIKILRNIGLKNRNECVVWSSNSRLDEIQAAMLRINLKYLDTWLTERRNMAHYYNQSLTDLVVVPSESKQEFHTYQTYTILAQNRDGLMKYLIDNQVDVKMYYPIPIHKQVAAQDLKLADLDFPKTAKLNEQILSLPLYPGLSRKNQDRIIHLIKSFYKA